MIAPLVGYEFSDGIATLTMDDGKANAMSVAMLQALNDALDRAQADGAAVLLTGRAGMFSGGFDLAVFKRGPDELFRMLEAGARMTERLLSFPKPVVAACSGHAVAMGLFLLLSTDVRIGVDGGARLQANEVQIGLTLPHFAIEVCRQRLAPAHLHLVAATAAPYTPEQALAAGMLDELVPAASLAAVARERTAKLLMLNAEAFTATKLRLRADSLTALRAAIDADLADWSQRFRPT
ncbi:crotonase/enoyl-CoA hydratase family protein [Rhizobacter fulvus]|jgi:enoyl-CoA hydratase